MKSRDATGVLSTLEAGGRSYGYFSLTALEKKGHHGISRMPRTVKILLESVLRSVDGRTVAEEHVDLLTRWKQSRGKEIPFRPARILMQDFTGVPAVVDLAAMRDAMKEMGGDPQRINPTVPVDLIIDHSVQVDWYGTDAAVAHNADREFQRNRERYELLRWASEAFDRFAVVPPATGICHQVNLEYLARVVQSDGGGGRAAAGKQTGGGRRAGKAEGPPIVYPDTLLGTDSHTTMINGLGVLAWGVGGIEAEAAMLGQPVFIPVPEVVGVRLEGRLPAGVTATDLVLRVTQMLREHGVVGRFVEFFGSGLEGLDLPDRATVSNMCPEYGATAALFPVDRLTLAYLRGTGRPADLLELIEAYTRAQGLFREPDSPDPEFSEVLELKLSELRPSIAGPKRPQDRIDLADAGRAARRGGPAKAREAAIRLGSQTVHIADGSVVIAAITSCTNTSNPSVMIGAGLLARNAVERGLRVPPYVKTSLAPGSRVVSRYLELSGLIPYLEALGFHLVGFGCTTCIGNSGPLHPAIARAIRENGLETASVLSGNRNFEGRIHPDVRASYLASPMLVVAYAIAGTMVKNLSRDPLDEDPNGNPVFLSDIWPSGEEIRALMDETIAPKLFEEEYATVYTGNPTWNAIKLPGETLYPWDPASTYVKRPSFLQGLTAEPREPEPIRNARVLAALGDSVTTDHISPAGTISPGTPAAEYLLSLGVEHKDFNSYGCRRGNHDVMVRGTFGNVRIRNLLVPGTEGGFTVHLPDGAEMSIHEAAELYRAEGVPLIVLAGKDYGMGSSRDWAAKGTLLLGVRAVMAESYERIHRSNLVGMGVLPLEFAEGESVASLGLTGRETFSVEAVREPRQRLGVTAGERRFFVTARIDSAVELEYYRNGGILPAVLRGMLQ